MTHYKEYSADCEVYLTVKVEDKDIPQTIEFLDKQFKDYDLTYLSLSYDYEDTEVKLCVHKVFIKWMSGLVSNAIEKIDRIVPELYGWDIDDVEFYEYDDIEEWDDE